MNDLTFHEISRIIWKIHEKDTKMGTTSLHKFSSQANPEVLETLKDIANAEGRKLHAVLDEAFRDYLSKKGALKPSQKAMTHFAKSLQEFDALYQDLAK
jgi:hypothetical protein